MKKELFPIDRIDKATGIFKAMAHPIRISILYLLKNDEAMTVTEIYRKLELEQSTISHHLGILKDKGVLCSTREGKNTLYTLKNKVFGQIIDCMQDCTCKE
ncbi:MAG TPA: metalloregulator ArsR/SmtB family transcription factor [Prolixibacteraceae bacterium]|nr:metalloregulator ArsR/SmtB family transcription factor [Prolixibacteraceae bacterium]